MESVFDIIYIINLQHHTYKKQKCINQLKKYNITNYVFLPAINTGKNDTYNTMYENIIKNMDANFVKNNFRKGALGCLLSHIECLKDAQKNGYNNILILEDDFIIIDNFDEKLKNFMNNVDNDWDFLYLGKKQGNDNDAIDININIHNNEKFNKIKDCNKYYYVPNYRTWGFHAISIKNTIFDDIIHFEKNIIAPIDLMIMTLYDKYNFYCIKEDLFISYNDSTIQFSFKQNNIWDWNLSLYNNLEFNKSFIIKNIIIFGLKNSEHTHKYILEMYYNFFNYYYPYLNIYWFNNDDIIDEKIIDNSIIFCSPCHDDCNNIPKRNDIYYILHVDDFEDKTIKQFLNDESNTIIKENNNYILLLCRENITNLKYFEKNVENKTLCLPWFSNELYEKTIYIKNNLEEVYETNILKKYLCYIGSIWYVNINMIKQLIVICVIHKIHLLLKGRLFHLSLEDKHFINNIGKHTEYITFLPYNETIYKNSFHYIDEKYGVQGLLPLQGTEHNNSYMSNRVFESISKGYLIVTNNLLTKTYFTTAIYNDNISELIVTYYKILCNKEFWISTMKKQINEYIEKFYGYRNINSIFNFMKEVSFVNNKHFAFFDDIGNYNLLFVNNSSYIKDDYLIIKTNKDIQNAMIHKNNYIIYPNDNYDIFLIEQFITFSNYSIYLDENIDNKQFIIDICNKYNKKYIMNL